MKIPSFSFTRYQLPAIVWALVIFVSSSIPAHELPKLGILKVDKLIHFGVFFVFCALTHRALKFQDWYPSLSSRSILFSILLTIFYGTVDEIHQAFVPNRDSNVFDLIADAFGALLYAGGLWVWARVRSVRSSTARQ
jgi:VanZ family protein